MEDHDDVCRSRTLDLISAIYRRVTSNPSITNAVLMIHRSAKLADSDSVLSGLRVLQKDKRVISGSLERSLPGRQHKEHGITELEIMLIGNERKKEHSLLTGWEINAEINVGKGIE